MELSQFIWYLIIINIIGVGIVLSMLIFGRKAEKENMMFRVFVACMLVIQIVLFLIIEGYVAPDISLAFGKFFSNHKILVVYLIVINFVTMIRSRQ